MATALATTPTEEIQASPYPITSDLFEQMIAQGLFPSDSRVFLWGGRLYEKMAKTLPHASTHNAWNRALTRRIPDRMFVGNENPVRLDEFHLPLPDMIVAKGEPFDFFDSRYPDGRDVLLVIEVAVSSLAADLGPRLSLYALTLPGATYLVADVPHRRVLIHSDPSPNQKTGRGEYGTRVEVGPGESIRLKLGGVEIDPIPFEEVMR